ncbi:FecCD family ABC transporter permease [Anaerostipes sp.]|uniref:FecCD family ABC transporter permease n=1 Tax=Anaerostipes sp. TaxID=1872530 RepID=UPI0025C088AD|nr:iron ABC transporter permease [Anaerostipes sp.]MBS7008816.1 iron ABC transporter permease [Anaerostipes sp.]
MKKRRRMAAILLTASLLAVFVGALMYGSYSMTAGDVLRTLFGKGDGMQNIAVFDLRLPRAVTAILVGAALSVSGCILQSVTKNELAEPGIIGINAGAAMAVVLLVSAQNSVYYSAIGMQTVLLMPVAAAAGAFISFLCIYFLARENGSVKPVKMILAGIGVNTGINALITLYQLNMSKGDYNQALAWIGGSLWGSSWIYAAVTAPIILILTGVVFYKNRILDVMDLGDEMAVGLGVSAERERKVLLVLAVCLAACATSVAGNIAFAGLIGPHLAKRLVGPVHRRQIPAAACISSILVLGADTLARTLFSPLEIPAGIMISLVGVPYFIYLLMKER